MTKIKQRLVTIVLFGLVATLGEYAYLRLIPDGQVVDMVEIVPTQEVFKLGEKPSFRTFAEYKKEGRVKWEDIQYCTYEGTNETFYYNQYVTTKYVDEAESVIGKKRNFDKPGPLLPAKCFLKNITTLELHFGVKKRDIEISGPYYYGHKF